VRVRGVMADMATFDEVFGAEYPRLVRALSVADDPADVEDAVQEAFVAAHRRWPYVVGLDDPVGWVRRAALNRISTGRRTRRRRAEILRRVRPPDPVTLDPLDLDLLEAIRALPPRQRRSLCLHHLGGYPIGEIAPMLGVAEGTVKSNLHDARSALRRLMEVPDDVH
jgi:RNA polymerase sigma-70 factor, ECF subfamily